MSREKEFNKIVHVINLIELIQNLCMEINDPDFHMVMKECEMNDDRLMEAIIYLKEMFNKD